MKFGQSLINTSQLNIQANDIQNLLNLKNSQFYRKFSKILNCKNRALNKLLDSYNAYTTYSVENLYDNINQYSSAFDIYLHSPSMRTVRDLNEFEKFSFRKEDMTDEAIVILQVLAFKKSKISAELKTTDNSLIRIDKGNYPCNVCAYSHNIKLFRLECCKKNVCRFGLLSKLKKQIEEAELNNTLDEIKCIFCEKFYSDSTLQTLLGEDNSLI